jgi:hypothetical protein
MLQFIKKENNMDLKKLEFDKVYIATDYEFIEDTNNNNNNKFIPRNLSNEKCLIYNLPIIINNDGCLIDGVRRIKANKNKPIAFVITKMNIYECLMSKDILKILKGNN